MTDTAKNGACEAQPELGPVQQQIPVGALAWTRKTQRGSSVYAAEVILGNNTYRFVVDSPRPKYWVARGWVNNSFTMFREAGAAKDAKAQAQGFWSAKLAEAEKGGAK